MHGLGFYRGKLLVAGEVSYFNMTNLQNDQLLQMETTCGSLLYELQVSHESLNREENSLSVLMKYTNVVTSLSFLLI